MNMLNAKHKLQGPVSGPSVCFLLCDMARKLFAILVSVQLFFFLRCVSLRCVFLEFTVMYCKKWSEVRVKMKWMN